VEIEIFADFNFCFFSGLGNFKSCCKTYKEIAMKKIFLSFLLGLVLVFFVGSVYADSCTANFFSGTYSGSLNPDSPFYLEVRSYSAYFEMVDKALRWTYCKAQYVSGPPNCTDFFDTRNVAYNSAGGYFYARVPMYYNSYTYVFYALNFSPLGGCKDTDHWVVLPVLSSVSSPPLAWQDGVGKKLSGKVFKMNSLRMKGVGGYEVRY
jgi:hypothetical protein